MDESRFHKAVALADHVAAAWDPKMKWTWGEALLGYALARLDDYRQTDAYTPFLKSYCDHYVKHPHVVDQSDTAAPGLITYAMQKKTGDPAYAALTDKVLDYIRNAPRILGDAVNHLGDSRIGKLYPRSFWVDSLMMFSVFPSWYARDHRDAAMMTIAARQPRAMADYLQDPATGLWYHSYWVKRKTHFPRRPIFWARGNGWVVAALPMILENIGDHPERAAVEAIFQRTCAALLPLQRRDGTFETVLARPGKTYRELSATALVAAGFLQGFRTDLLDERYRDAGIRAYRAVADAIRITDRGVFLPEISGPTTPLPVFPYLGYAWMPRKANWSYGIAAALFAAIEYDRLPEGDGR